jgi:enterochelin esterase-like enzyme
MIHQTSFVAVAIFAAFVAGELVPWAVATWRCTDDPARTVVAGSSLGGLGATFMALRHPHRFGNVVAQSPSFWWHPDTPEQRNYEVLAAKNAAQPESIRELVAAKRRWIETHPTATLARRRCQEIRAINERLAALLEGERVVTEAEMARSITAEKAQTVLRSREVPWCFFPENVVKSFLLLENGAGPA